MRAGDAAYDEFGERVGTDALRFVRRLPVPPQTVWAALTTPDGISAWLGRPITIETRAGGIFSLAFGAGDLMDGRVIECEPHKRLSIDWHETSGGASAPYGTRDGDRSVVSFKLTPDGAGTLLVFEHRYIRGGETMAGFGAGWRSHLAALRAFVGGEAAVDRDALYTKLEPSYAKIAQPA